MEMRPGSYASPAVAENNCSLGDRLGQNVRQPGGDDLHHAANNQFATIINNQTNHQIEEQGRKSTLPGFLTVGLLRQHLGLACADPQY